MSQLLHPETKAQQSQLATYCRTGEVCEVLGTTAGRKHHYRRLVFNVVRDALTNSYPLTVNLLTEKEWASVCHTFFEEHECQDPQVWKMPLELIGFVENRFDDLCKKYPHLIELLVFEWKEVEYYMMPDRIFPVAMKNDPWKETWSLNPEAEIMTLKFPVHLKNARFISRTDEGQFFCLIFRQPETANVKFLNLSPFFAWMLATMMSEPCSLEDLFPLIQKQFGLQEEEVLLANSQPFFQKLCADGMISI